MNPLIWIRLGMVAVVVVALTYATHKYNDYIRAPLLKQITLLEDLRKADASRANQEIAARKAENENALKGYIEYARNSDSNYAAALGKLRDHAAALKRSGPAGQDGTGNPATSDSSPAAVAAGGEPDPVSAEIAIYAAEVRLYAQSCYEFVNGK